MATNLRQTLQEVAQSGRPTISDLALIGRVRAPVLLLHGAETHPHFTAIARYLTERLPDVRVGVVPGAGHLGPQLAPAAVTEEAARFFTSVTVPA
jgi:pimeloyl-ACP methyl ester carboxylesterase